MTNFDSLGRILVVAGLGLALVGLVVLVGGRLGLPMGRLPGDITFQLGSVTVFVPLLSCIVVSVVLTLIVNLVLWIVRR